MKNFCIACGHEVEVLMLNSRFLDGEAVMVWRCKSCQFFVRHEVNGTVTACKVGSVPMVVPEGALLVVQSEGL